jgi:hypothetical protein
MSSILLAKFLEVDFPPSLTSWRILIWPNSRCFRNDHGRHIDIFAEDAGTSGYPAQSPTRAWLRYRPWSNANDGGHPAITLPICRDKGDPTVSSMSLSLDPGNSLCMLDGIPYCRWVYHVRPQARMCMMDIISRRVLLSSLTYSTLTLFWIL